MPTPELSIVVPVYGCADCLTALYERVAAALDATDPDWELVLIDDASPDGAWELMCALAARDRRVRSLRLSRNFGQHAAITAGLAESRGRWVAVMDCDLQDPPEEIPRLLATAREGYDVVLTRRDQRRQAWHRRVGARIYFRLRNHLLGTKVDTEYSMLSVISRSVTDAFLRMGDRDRQYMLILHWLGFRRAVLELEHVEREVGRSSYTLRTLLQVAMDGMFFQTTVLLRWTVYVGFALAGAGVALAAAFVGLYFLQRPLPGFTTLAVLILLVGGFIMLSTGITGLYVGKIFEQVKARPLYVVAEQATADTPTGEQALEPVPAPAVPPAVIIDR
jgi:glycosyltransferase involved in cell wall biosynthesis